ncbi:MAG: exonuclease SbcCD subunit D [Dehalococcoidia bacterium]
MRILHFADLHLGMETYGTIDSSTGLSTRLLDVLRCLDELVEYAINSHIDLVLFCGDAYKSRDPSQTHQREFAKRIRRLSEAHIPVFLLVGNHDLPNAVGRATSVDIYHTLAIEQVYVGNKPGVYPISTKEGIIQIAALPWLRRSALMSREEMRNLSIDQVNEKLQEILTAKVFEATAGIDIKLPAILAAHITVSNAKSGSETSMIMGRDPLLLLSNISQPVFDYVALGHIHKGQVLNESPPVVYAGSLERFDFGDEGQEKGFYEVTIDSLNGEKQVSYEFHPVKARRFLTIQADIDIDEPDPTAVLVDTIMKYQHDIRDAIVRIQVTLPKKLEGVIRDAEIYKMLEEAYYVVVSRDIKQDEKHDNRLFVSEELRPIEALSKYLELKKLPEDHRNLLLEYGENLIKEAIGEKEEHGE